MRNAKNYFFCSDDMKGMISGIFLTELTASGVYENLPRFQSFNLIWKELFLSTRSHTLWLKFSVKSEKTELSSITQTDGMNPSYLV